MISRRPNVEVLGRYGAAVGLSVLCTGLTASSTLIEKTPFVLFYAAIALSARFLGVGPALLNLAISIALVDRFVLAPGEWATSQQDIITLVSFLGVALLIISIARQKSRADRRLAQSLEEARVNLKRLELIEGAVNAGTWEFDIGSGLSHWPPGISALWGLPRVDHSISIDEFLSRIYPDDRDRVMHTIEHSFKLSEPCEVELRVVWPDQSVHWLAIRGAALRDWSGIPRKVIGIAMDVTERHQAEHALRESEKLATTGRFAATIAHEINNPLEAITNLVYLAKLDPNLCQHTRDLLHHADTELNRCGHIVRQTLGFYRESKSPVWVNLSEVAEQMLSLYQRKIASKNITLSHRIDPDAKVFGYDGELRQVLANLIANAIDAVPIGGHISIRVETTIDIQRCRVVRIVVIDDGHGITEASQSKLFQPFFTTKKDVGTGLGLWVSKGIIEKHHGTIRMRTSTRRGRSGTAFRVDIPVEAMTQAVPATA